ncbi:MAG TPA: PEP-CTERM sorting domain-containing protein [candidate division Zixibacteria bacterium]|nr:PEP-CTERM sorting domain-containing protein [candidate division Zixibacteria bacterium]
MKRLIPLLCALAVMFLMVDFAQAVGYPNSGYTVNNNTGTHRTANSQTDIDTHPDRIPADDASAVQQQTAPEGEVTPIPEPIALLLVGVGLLAIAVMRKSA